jgi:archaemetzincin
MKIALLRLGQVDQSIVTRIEGNLKSVFVDAETTLAPEILQLPEEAFSKARGQYRSDFVLVAIRRFVDACCSYDRVLGVVDVDLFVPRLSFVFGEAESPGRAAVISLWRLRPEYYKRAANSEVLVERATKEAVHELGHTMGLKHCVNPYCVMYFSNSIFETDRKQGLFCNRCYLKIDQAKSEEAAFERRV